MFHKKPPPEEKLKPKKFFSLSIEEKEGRAVLHWEIDPERLKQSAKEKLQGGASAIVGSLVDRLFKKKESDE